jgi:2-amino-4-hydroxy-6-hydroxymethyldihydropteridine diphosphokinase
MQPQTVYLSMGSNLGDREENLRQALSALASEHIEPRRVSSCYETEPVGYRDQPWFLNIAVETSTSLSPDELLNRCRHIESKLGRRRSFHGAPRTLDIDILLYGDQVIAGETLVIPHPRMQDRRFVLKPLSDIAPQVLHPLLNQTVQALFEACRDRSSVRLYPEFRPQTTNLRT